MFHVLAVRIQEVGWMYIQPFCAIGKHEVCIIFLPSKSALENYPTE